jgi:hypothetical protein
MDEGRRKVMQLGAALTICLLLLLQLLMMRNDSNSHGTFVHEDGATVVTVGNCSSKSIGGGLRLSFCGNGSDNGVIDIRFFIFNPKLGYQPTTKGINLNLVQWIDLLESKDWVEEHL